MVLVPQRSGNVSITILRRAAAEWRISMNITSRAQLKAQTRELLQTAQVSPKTFTALYCGITLLLNLLTYFVTTPEIVAMFVSILATLSGWVLTAGLVLYCMGIRRQERVEYATLFDGFSFTGKIILLNIFTEFLMQLWALLFVIPGVIAYYRYSFAFYNLYENPELDIMTALEMSKQQTRGMKLELFKLDLSYIGWFLLAKLPSLIFNILTFIMVAHGDLMVFLTTATPLWQILVEFAWLALVALFYLPNYHCVMLDYFDTAKAHLAEAASFRPEDGPEDPGGF